MNHAISNKTISEIHIEDDFLAEQEKKEELKTSLQQEKLPGTIKSQWALKYKLNLDKAILDALSHEEVIKEKVKTKGRFQIEASTNAGSWIKDRKWMHLANPGLKAAEIAREEIDMRLLQKRQQQKLIQNMALEQQYKIVVKKPKN